MEKRLIVVICYGEIVLNQQFTVCINLKGILKKPAMPGLIEEGDEEESVVATHKTPSSRGGLTTGPVSGMS